MTPLLPLPVSRCRSEIFSRIIGPNTSSPSISASVCKDGYWCPIVMVVIVVAVVTAVRRHFKSQHPRHERSQDCTAYARYGDDDVRIGDYLGICHRQYQLGEGSVVWAAFLLPDGVSSLPNCLLLSTVRLQPLALLQWLLVTPLHCSGDADQFLDARRDSNSSLYGRVSIVLRWRLYLGVGRRRDWRRIALWRE
jgi:hypothetical protein